MWNTLLYIFVSGIMWREISGHGRLMDPPARGTMWRLGFDTPPNYNDHQLFCGGFFVSKMAILIFITNYL